MICTVGGQPLPVVTAVRENGRLDRVYFLCSAGLGKGSSAAAVRRATARETRRRCPACGAAFVDRRSWPALAEMAQLRASRYAIEEVEDPDDLGQVLAACERIEADVRRRWPRCAPEVIANYTGGTKTMSLGLALHALRRSDGAWTLQLNRLAAGGRTDLVGIRAGDQPVFQDLSWALSAAASDWAAALAEGHDYGAAASVVSRALTHQRLRGEDQRRLLAAGLRYRLLSARDRGDFAAALELAAEDRKLESLYGPRLRRLARIVSALEAGPWPDAALTGLDLVDELRDAAGRGAGRGRLDEAAELLVAACHTLARLRLRRVHAEAGSGDLWADYQRLAETGDALGRYFAAHERELRALVEPCRWRFRGLGGGSHDRGCWTVAARRWAAWLDGAQEIL